MPTSPHYASSLPASSPTMRASILPIGLSRFAVADSHTLIGRFAVSHLANVHVLHPPSRFLSKVSMGFGDRGGTVDCLCPSFTAAC